MRLRPHHVLGYFYYLKDFVGSGEKEFIRYYRKYRSDHSDETIRCWESICKKLNRNAQFVYVTGLKGEDSCCRKCEHKKNCHDKEHEFFRVVDEYDKWAIKHLPELKFGHVYDGRYLRELFRKKGWLPKDFPIKIS